MIQNHPIAAIRVFVADLPGARIFYRDKLQLDLKIDGETYGFLIFQLHSCDLIIEVIPPAEMESEGHLIGRFIETSFKSSDIQKDYQALLKADIQVTEPQKQHWGGILMLFSDPEGNQFTLVED